MPGRLIARSVAGSAVALVLLALVLQILGEFACGTVQRRGPAALVQAACAGGAAAGDRVLWRRGAPEVFAASVSPLAIEIPVLGPRL